MPKANASPPDEDRSLCHNLALRQASRHLSQVYDRHLAPSGLRGSQYSILSRLNRLGPMSIGKLADIMVIERTALGRALRPLERDHLISIGPGPDKRTNAVSLTAAGQARLKSAAALWRKAQAEFEKSFGSAAAAQLRNALQRVAVL